MMLADPMHQPMPAEDRERFTQRPLVCVAVTVSHHRGRTVGFGWLWGAPDRGKSVRLITPARPPVHGREILKSGPSSGTTKGAYPTSTTSTARSAKTSERLCPFVSMAAS